MPEENSNTLSLGRQQTKDPKTWFPLLAGSFVFLDMGPFKNFLVYPSFLVALVYLWLAGFNHKQLSIPYHVFFK
jgi:hypothetical protein